MPFAVIAVTILLVSAIAAGVVAAYDRSSESSDSMIVDIDAVDLAIADVTAYANKGLGEIIRAASVDADLGGLNQRCTVIKERSDEWFSFQFPMVSGGARVTYVSHEMELVAEPMGLSNNGGCIGTYLRGVGSISVIVESQYGKSETDLDISTDGNYALPLAVERAALFQSMSSGSGIALTQMLEYQLASIAQYRVLDGYGGLRTYGDRGTDAILTEDDVKRAYSTGIEALAATCFRNGPYASYGAVDLADAIASNDGRIELDLDAIYAQALYSVADEITLGWLDYLYGYKVASALDKILNPFKNAFRSLGKYLSGEERVSGVPYLKKVMEDSGFDESSYRYPGSGTTTVSVGEYTVTVNNPVCDLFAQSWLTDFKKRYDRNDDYVRDFVTGVVKDAAVRAADRNALGTISMDVDPYDGRSFKESLLQLYEEAVTRSLDSMQKGISESLRAGSVYDEFYGCLADEVSSHEAELADTGALYSRIRAALSAAIEERAKDAETNEEEFIRPDIGSLMSSPSVSAAIASYRSAVHHDISPIQVLKTVEGGKDSLLHRGLSLICSYGLEGLNVLFPAEKEARTIVSEILANDSMNPYSGIIGLPGSEGFELEDESGATVTEHLSFHCDTKSLTVSIGRPEGIHNVGFRVGESAAFTTKFPVSISGWVDYAAEGAGSLAQSMGSTTAVVKGGFDVHLELEIVVASGWGLSGVSYEPSCTILTDLQEILLKIFEPIIEPLREIMKAIRGAMTALGEALREVAGFVSENLLELYRFLMDPLDELSRMIQETLESAISETVFGILFDINLGDQSITLQFFGCELELKTKAVTWTAKTKTLMIAELRIPVAGLLLTAGFTAKIKGDVSAENLILTGSGGIAGDGWSVEADFDPLMKGSKYLFTLKGSVGKNRISISAPKLESYHELGLTLSDVPGLGQVLDSIPLPIPGAKLSIDAGFQIRCRAATEVGLIINEYESNPPGTDRGNEWVEILNNTDSTIDLNGCSLDLDSKKRKGSEPLSGELKPGEFLVIRPSFTLVNTAGDSLVLRGSDGDELDRVKMKADSADDDESWQRGYDGSSEWVKAKSTMGRTNGSWISSSFSIEQLKDVAWKAVEKSFGKVEHITDLDSLVAFIQYLVRYTIEGLIDLVADMIIDASLFVSADIKDASSSGSAGIRVALRTDGDLVKDCLRYIAGKAESLILGIKNPYRIDPLEMFTENIDLEVLAHAGVGFPEVLSKGMDLPEMDLAVLFRANLSSLSRIVDVDTGRPEMEFGIMARNCPLAAIPSKLRPNKQLEHDLWLFKAVVTLA